MLILAFETSAKAASAALLEDGKLLGESYQNTGLTHSQTLMVMAENLLHQCGKTVNDVNAVAVAAGPGSFTGVRIGVAAAKGFAWGREVPCYGVSTLEAMALSLGEYQGYVCPVMDARRSQVYHALFYVNHGSLKRITEDCAIALEQLKQELPHVFQPAPEKAEKAAPAAQQPDHYEALEQMLNNKPRAAQPAPKAPAAPRPAVKPVVTAPKKKSLLERIGSFFRR